MRKMKDSGVAWLESIPETWNLLQLGSLFLEHKHKNVGMQSSNLLSLSYGKIIQKNINATDGLLPESFEGYNVIDAGDIVLRLTDLQNDQRSLRVGLCGESGIITSAYTTLRRRNDALNSKYFYYLLHSYDIRKGFYGMGAGVRQGLNYAGVRKIMLTVPPESEQTAIAECLDRKTAQVDALISNVQAQIEKLKTYKQSLITEVVTKGLDPNVPMKDSGVEWIGKIPKHWNMIRVRFIAKITTGNQDTQNADPDGMYPFYVRSPIVERCNNYTFEGKGILMAGDGAGAGRVFHLVNGKYAVHQRVYRFYDFKYMNPVLLKFYLENLFATVMDYGSAKTTVPSVRLPMIQDFPVCVPPEDEQLKMLEVLSEKTNKIDRFIAVKQTKIEKLEQYKRSLIYEYVTGKKEVS